MRLCLVLLFLFILFFVHLWMKNIFRRSAGQPLRTQAALLILFEILLAELIVSTFLLVWNAILLVWVGFLPVILTSEAYVMFWDLPLTSRVFFGCVLLLWFPYYLFFNVSLICIRDAHQVAKEQLDRVRKLKKVNFLWDNL